MCASHVKTKQRLLHKDAALRATRRRMVIMTSRLLKNCMVRIQRSRYQQLTRSSQNLEMKKKAAQMVQMQVFSTVDSVANHSPNAQFFRFMSVPRGHTNPITVVTVISRLTIQTSCARMLSSTLQKNHSSAAIVIDHSRERRLFITTCARTLEKNHFRARDAERILPRPRSYIGTRDYQETVSHT